MKKLFIILLSAMALTAVATEKKSVAIHEPKGGDAMVANMVKSSLTNALARSDEWQPVAEMSLEQMMNALDNNTGTVTGLPYMLITEIQDMGGMYHISCRIMNGETGMLAASAMEMAESSPKSIQEACASLAKQLLEKQ